MWENLRSDNIAIFSKTRSLYAYSARLLDDDSTTIPLPYWRSPDYVRQYCGRIIMVVCTWRIVSGIQFLILTWYDLDGPTHFTLLLHCIRSKTVKQKGFPAPTNRLINLAYDLCETTSWFKLIISFWHSYLNPCVCVFQHYRLAVLVPVHLLSTEQTTICKMTQLLYGNVSYVNTMV